MEMQFKINEQMKAFFERDLAQLKKLQEQMQLVTPNNFNNLKKI